jgi:hypothetical protein
MVEMKNICSILVGRPKGKKLLGRPRIRWEGNFRIDLMVIAWECVDCMHLP